MYIMLQVQQPCLQQELFNYGARRLLLQVVPSPPTSTNFTDPPPFDNSSFDMNSHFSPSMAIILVVLLSAFFFMGFFSVYVRRCTTDDDQNDMRRDIHNHMSNRVTEQQGLDPAMVANLPMVAYSASIKKKGCNECVVCLTEFEEDEPLKLLPKCKHAFHTDCIDMWLFSHTTCPLCRRSLVGGGSTRSFRWGSSRRTSFNYNEGSSRGGRQQQQTAEVTPPEIQLTVTDDAAAPRPPLPPSGKRRALRRSNSTGHSLLRRAWSRTALPFSSTPLASALVTASPGGATVIPAAMHRSRSVSAMSGGRNHEEVDLAAVEGVRPRLTRGWSVSQLRRALSLRSSQLQDATAFSTPVGQAAASSSTRRTFERLGA